MIFEVYNSNKYFLVNHRGTDKIKYEWLLEEVKTMRKADFYSCKVVKKSSHGVAYAKMIFRTLRKLKPHKCKYFTR